MIRFTTRYINTVSFIISVIIVFFLNNYVLSINIFNSENHFISNQFQNQVEEDNNNYTKESENNTANQADQNTKSENANIKTDWQLEIPKINLNAPINEGTSKEIMDLYIGHFEETPKDIGNIGLAAHNRGYNVNYFQDLKRLVEGDEIIYTYDGKQRKYFVKLLKIIKDTDWTLLENTAENTITLITCVENQPEFRRCVQAVENYSK